METREKACAGELCVCVGARGCHWVSTLEGHAKEAVNAAVSSTHVVTDKNLKILVSNKRTRRLRLLVNVQR